MKHQAIHNLYQASVVTDDAGVFSAFDSSGNPIQLNETEITAEIARLQAEYDSLEYQRLRQPEYPTMQEQLDMQYWDSIDGTTTWQDAIDAVKAKFPKPTES